MPKFSFIIPLYNRPEEIRDLLASLCELTVQKGFEVIIVEDGSTRPSEEIVNAFKGDLDLQYHFKENSGPGLTRNRGAQQASGDWLIFLDSDCIVPSDYLVEVDRQIEAQQFDVFGGPDKADESFSRTQKAINYSMTAFLTTGGIRGGKKQLENYKPRSFNMGIKKEVFKEIDGFRDMRFGEDIDLSIRLQTAGYRSILIENAFVFHKRRSNFRQFYKQVFNSGVARIHLATLHPGSLKIVHTFPALFVLFSLFTLLLALFNWMALIPLILYLSIIILHSSVKNRSPLTGILSAASGFIQLSGYGIGFMGAVFQVYILGKTPKFGFSGNFYD